MRFHGLFIFLLCGGAAFSQANASGGSDARYRLQPSDVVEIHYRYTPEFDQTVTVQPDGFLNLQIVGDVKAQGRTAEELKAATNPASTEPLAELQPGDLLVVPQNRISKIERLVKLGNLGLYWNPIP